MADELSNRSDKKKTFDAQLGAMADIHRSTDTSDKMPKANAQLEDIGEFLNPNRDALEYKGSICVHIYHSPHMKQFFCVEQIRSLATRKCQESLAIAAMKSITGTVMEAFGHRRPKLRSGF